MFLVSMISAMFSGFACYFILRQFYTFPSSKADRIILTGGGKKSFNVLFETSLIAPIAKRIEPLMRLEEYKREFLQQTLTTAGIASTAEQYTSGALSYAIIMAVALLPLAVLISPVLLLGCVLIGLICYKSKMDAAQKIVAKKRRKIEMELPRFSSTIHEQLATTRDVVKIFEGYRKICPKDFEEEITKTLADMKTGNHETALRNFENRMGSYKLSEVIRGLIGVLNGNNQIMHFQILTNDLIRAENEELRREALSRPGKLMPTEILLFFCLAFMLVVSIGQFTVSTAQSLF